MDHRYQRFRIPRNSRDRTPSLDMRKLRWCHSCYELSQGLGFLWLSNTALCHLDLIAGSHAAAQSSLWMDKGSL